VARATPPPDAAWRVTVGDSVRLTMRDGRHHDLTIRTVDTGAIVGSDGTRYDQADILAVERRQFSGTKTAVLAGGLIAGAILIALAAAQAAVLGGWQ
jgi:hypothetical protein